uniref:Uncharacterized protein n=1 Tax=viral metagenome TaxID=1070528 RepID=A0A6C0DHA3_9ZZZZ
MKESQTRRFCSCIKKVRKYIKPRRGTKESAATAICVKSVLQTRGRTLRKFHCKTRKGKKAYVATQDLIKK